VRRPTYTVATMKTLSRIVAVALSLSILPMAACKSAEEKEAARVKKAEEKAAKEREAEIKLQAVKDAIRAKLPADSPLQKIDFGMSEAEVAVQLGAPTTQKTKPTGRAWNPWNVSGKDSMRTTFYYQGIGRVEFGNGSWGKRNGVVDLIHDASETGTGTAPEKTEEVKDEAKKEEGK
jgi:hypothetical protein